MAVSVTCTRSKAGEGLQNCQDEASQIMGFGASIHYNFVLITTASQSVYSWKEAQNVADISPLKAPPLFLLVAVGQSAP